MSVTHFVGDDVSPSQAGARERLSPFRIEITQDFATAERAWIELEAAGSAFQSRAWLGPWYKFIAPSVKAEPLFVTVRDRATGRPLIFFPFCLRRICGVKIVEFPDLGVTDYNAPICAPDVEFTDEQLEALWAEVRLAIPGVDLFRIEKTPEALYGRPLPFARLGWLSPMELRCWTIELPDSRERYDKTVLRSKDRKEQRRKRRNLVDKLGEPELLEAATREQAREFFETLKRMRAERFRRQGRRDIFREAQFAPFYQAVAAAGWQSFVSLVNIQAAGAPIAALMALRHAGNYVLIMHSFAADLEQLSPGIVALDELMTHLIDGKTRHCDFTTGNEPYKKQFGVSECGMRHGHDAVTAQGRLYSALSRESRKMRARLAKSCGEYARALRRSWSASVK